MMVHGLLRKKASMLEKPDIDDTTIMAALNENYSIQADRIEFLPVGNDASAWAYRVDAENQDTYFLKVRDELSSPAGVLVPRFLRDRGIEQVLAPLPTNDRELWTRLGDFVLILYPFIAGREAMDVGMSEAQWREFGSIMRQIHAAEPAPELSGHLMRETFLPKWSQTVREIKQRVYAPSLEDPYQKELAAVWKEKAETIQMVLERAERLGGQLQEADLKFVICHADIHSANILLTQDRAMFIVDWDGTCLAPKERDLMFVMGTGSVPSKEEQMFFQGYGQGEINLLALAYYRYEWCIQEIGDYGARVFLMPDLGERTKQRSVEEFVKLFSQGDVIDIALRTPPEI
jgi:spectinomycin phosphotransferase